MENRKKGLKDNQGRKKTGLRKTIHMFFFILIRFFGGFMKRNKFLFFF